jgi:hypothetical protein
MRNIFISTIRGRAKKIKKSVKPSFIKSGKIKKEGRCLIDLPQARII